MVCHTANESIADIKAITIKTINSPPLRSRTNVAISKTKYCNAMNGIQKRKKDTRKILLFLSLNGYNNLLMNCLNEKVSSIAFGGSLITNNIIISNNKNIRDTNTENVKI